MKHSLRFATYLFAVLGLVSVSNRASAAWVETFTGGFDQPSWVIFDDAGNLPPDRTTLSTASNALEMKGFFGSGPTYDSSVAGIVISEMFTDVVVKATVSSLTAPNFAGGSVLANNDIFVAARSDGANSYILALDFLNGDVEMGRVSPGGVYNDFPGAGNSDTIPGFNPSLAYDLVLSCIGDSLTGKVFLGGSEIASVSYDTSGDAVKLTQGWSGIGAALNPEAGGGATLIGARFDNVSSVPEPGSVLLVLGSVVGLIAFKRRKK